MGTAETRALKRLGRGLFSITLSALLGYLTKQPILIAVAPVLNALGKWVRGRFTLPMIPF